MKRLLSFLVLNALLCPAYAMDTIQHLTKLEETIEQYVNTDAIAGQILRYYLLGKISVTQFKDILKKKEVFKDLAKILHIEEATLDKHFTLIAPHLSEITNTKVLDLMLARLIDGKQVTTQDMMRIVDQKKAITLASNTLGFDSNQLQALVERITDDPLVKHKATIKSQFDAINTETANLNMSIAKIQAKLHDKTRELTTCKSNLDARNIAFQASLHQNSSSNQSTLLGAAATALLFSQSVCLSCDSYINSTWLTLTALSAATTAMLHNNSSQKKATEIQNASSDIQAQIAAKADLENEILTLSAELLRLNQELNAADQEKTRLAELASQLDKIETERGSVLDQSWQVTQGALKNQAIQYLAKKAGVDLKEMQADQSKAEMNAFIEHLKPEQVEALSNKDALVSFTLMPEVITMELPFLVSLDNDQCIALAQLLEGNNAEKVEGFEKFGALVADKIALLEIPGRFLLAQYVPVFLLIAGEEAFINKLSENESSLLIAMFPEEIQKALQK